MTSARNRLLQSSGNSWADLAQEEIIETFFKSKKKKAAPGPGHRKKPAMKSGPRRPEKPARSYRFLLMPILAIFLIIIILYVKSNMEKPGSRRVQDTRAETLLEKGELNRETIARAYPEGDAVKSVFRGDDLILVNNGPHGRAAFVMVFDGARDLEKKMLVVRGRGVGRTNKVNVVLKDADNRYVSFPDIYFSSWWELKRISLFQEFSDCDLTRTKELKLEFGTYTAGNPQNSVMEVREIGIEEPAGVSE